MTREDARALWVRSGLTYDALTPKSLSSLRGRINSEMLASGVISGTFRARQRFSCGTDRQGRRHADLRCHSDYFDNRQAITFEADGFIGFAGWADDLNVAPILKAFSSWVEEMASSTPQH